mmetsp:Transcript_33387/g.99447  ORF Transcript_33387/g.99447 Transcript_33387/m.99447 type:complete len:218 (-) Transcript_33387:758-1411(-)
MRRRRMLMELRSPPPPPSSFLWARACGMPLLLSLLLVASEGLEDRKSSPSSDMACSSEAVERKSAVSRPETDTASPRFFPKDKTRGSCEPLLAASGSGAAPVRLLCLPERCRGVRPGACVLHFREHSGRSSGPVGPQIHSCRRASAASGRSSGFLAISERIKSLHMSVASLRRGLTSKSTTHLRMLRSSDAASEPSNGSLPDSVKKSREPALKQSTF